MNKRVHTTWFQKRTAAHQSINRHFAERWRWRKGEQWPRRRAFLPWPSRVAFEWTRQYNSVWKSPSLLVVTSQRCCGARIESDNIILKLSNVLWKNQIVPTRAAGSHSSITSSLSQKKQDGIILLRLFLQLFRHCDGVARLCFLFSLTACSSCRKVRR